MSDFNKNENQLTYDFFQRTESVGLYENLNGSMLDQLDYARFIELAWLLDPKAFTYGEN